MKKKRARNERRETQRATDTINKAGPSILTLSLALKISRDGVSRFKGTARGFECFRGCTNCGTIDNRERLWKKGRINWFDEMPVEIPPVRNCSSEKIDRIFVLNPF